MIDKEITALTQCTHLLAALEPAARERVLYYLNGMFSRAGVSAEAVAALSSLGSVVPAASAAQAKESAAAAGAEKGSSARGRSLAKAVDGADEEIAAKSTAARARKAEGRVPRTIGVKRKREYELIKDLNLRPEGKENLKSFFTRFGFKNFPETHTAIVYYFSEILGDTEVNLSKVYTAYKHLRLKTPKDLYQSFVQTASNTKLFNTENINSITLTPKGIELINSGEPTQQPE